MIPWSFCWNNIRLRPLRFLLTVISIAGGVASIVAVVQATAATRNQLDSLHQAFSSRVAMQIVATDDEAFPLSDLPSLQDVPGVQLVVPTYRVFTLIYSGKQHIRAVATGVDLKQYQSLRDYEITTGRIAEGPEEVCLEAGAAERLNVHVGDDVQLRIRARRWLTPRTVTGIIKPRGLSSVEESASLFMSREAAGGLEQQAGDATSLLITLAPGADSDEVAAKIRPLLPAKLKVVNSSTSSDLSRPTEEIVNSGLNVAAGLSVVAAIFIVINTFQISIAERKRQLALLRIVGATIGQVRSSIYQEALLLGGVGTILGVGLGIALSRLLAQGVQTLFGLTESVPFGIRPGAILSGVIFGPLVTLVSVWSPARAACDLPPLQVLKSATAPNRMNRRRGSLLWAITTAICCAGFFLVRKMGIEPGWMAVFGIAMMLVSSTLFLPSLIRPGCELITRLIGWKFPVEFQLGKSQLLDNFGRTALTTAVMFVVSATSVSVGLTTLSVTSDVNGWLDRTLTSDFLLRSSRPRVDMPEADSLPDDLEAQLRAIPGIEAIDPLSYSLANVQGISATLMTRPMSSFQTVPVDLIEGDEQKLRDQMLAGEAVVGSVLSHRIGCHAGDQFQMEIGGIKRSVRVAGIVREYTSGGLMVVMDYAVAEALFPIRSSQVYGIRASREQVDSVGTALRAVAHDRGLIYQSLADLRGMIRRMVAGITSRLWMILLLALVIAGFAIINTLTMSVIQQTRLLGMLRVVGMTRFQVIRMFLLQALMLGLISLVPGTVVGLALACVITNSFEGVADHGVKFTFEFHHLAFYLAMGMTLSLLSAIIPAIRAGQLNPLEAIHEE